MDASTAAHDAGRMAFEVHPLTADRFVYIAGTPYLRFDDFAHVVNPNRRATHCWCLSPRLSAPQRHAPGDPREDTMRALAAGEPAPGVVGTRTASPSRGAASARAARSRGS